MYLNVPGESHYQRSESMTQELWDNFLYVKQSCAKQKKKYKKMLVFFPNSFTTLTEELHPNLPVSHPPLTTPHSFQKKNYFIQPKHSNQAKHIRRRIPVRFFLPYTVPGKDPQALSPCCPPPLLHPLDTHPEWWWRIQKFIVDVAYWDQGSYPSPHKKGWGLSGGPEHPFTPLWLYYVTILILSNFYSQPKKIPSGRTSKSWIHHSPYFSLCYVLFYSQHSTKDVGLVLLFINKATPRRHPYFKVFSTYTLSLIKFTCNEAILLWHSE